MGKKKAKKRQKAAGVRHFEFFDGKSQKFWEIKQSGKSHTVRFGRIGTDGQTKTKEFDSTADAKASYEKLIAEKTGKGYVESGGQKPAAPKASPKKKKAAKKRKGKLGNPVLDGEEPFVRSILDAPYDDDVRQVYADWLEERGDLRGELIRTQDELAGMTSKDESFAKMCQREKDLLKQVDPAWLAVAQRFTTAPMWFDFATLVPKLKKLTKTAVRIHGRPLKEDLPLDARKWGGKILWPEDEPWPVGKKSKAPYVPVMQLRKCDVPNIKFKPGADLLQVLWCPETDDLYPFKEWPSATVRWRKASAVKNPLDSFPYESYSKWKSAAQMPNLCSIHPEQIVEYPDIGELTWDYGDYYDKEFCEAIEKLDLEKIAKGRNPEELDSPSWIYQDELSVYGFTKVGGHVNWIQDPKRVECDCGRRMEYLLTISGALSGSGRWTCLEQQRQVTRKGEVPNANCRGPGVEAFGGYADSNYYFYVCRKCKEWPTKMTS